MKATDTFLRQPKHFWANVRTISQKVGYTQGGMLKVPTLTEILAAYTAIGLDTSHVALNPTKPSPLGRKLLSYFDYRARILTEFVKPRLMTAQQARALFNKMHKKCSPNCPIPLNKQKGEKKAPAYFTGIVNMLIEANSNGLNCDYDPRQLTTVTKNGAPLRTLARRIDGAFPSAVNPVSVWEIKEYYYTTTFGSRVADGIYETLLDGMELEELREHEHIDVKHYLMIDAYYTWWECGRSYLCRIIDMLHMGYVDEVLFGKEVLDRLPNLVKEWANTARSRSTSGRLS